MRASALVARQMGMMSVGRCRRVPQSDRNCRPADRTPETYTTPLERRVDQLIRGSRART
jgi:hypothetical protein